MSQDFDGEDVVGIIPEDAEGEFLDAIQEKLASMEGVEDVHSAAMLVAHEHSEYEVTNLPKEGDKGTFMAKGMTTSDVRIVGPEGEVAAEAVNVDEMPEVEEVDDGGDDEDADDDWDDEDDGGDEEEADDGDDGNGDDGNGDDEFTDGGFETDDSNGSSGSRIPILGRFL